MLRVCLSFSPFVLVFALVFHSFALLLSSCFASCPFTFFALVVFACRLYGFVFVVSFSLSDYTDKKKGRKGFAPCVLSSFVVCVMLDDFKHYLYLLRFIVPVSSTFANDSCDLFRLVRWTVYYLPVFVNY